MGKDSNLQSPDPSSKKENVRQSKKETKPTTNSNLLGNLPGFGARDNSGFEEFDFEESSPPKKAKSKTKSKLQAAEEHLDDFYQDE